MGLACPTKTMKEWAGRAAAKARATVATWLPTPCPYCGHEITPDQRWDVDHNPPRHILKAQGIGYYNPDTWRPAHASCNRRAGARAGNKLRRQRPTGERRRAETGSFSQTATPGAMAVDINTGGGIPVSGGDGPVWHPDGFVLPRVRSVELEGLDFTIGDAVIAWIDSECPGDALLPWQRWTIRQGLALRDGRLAYRDVVVMVSRQQGKTYMMRRVLLARAMRPDLFGGADQSVLNVHLDVSQAIALLEDWARELSADGRGYFRMRANYGEYWPGGTPGVGSVWRAKAQTKRAITGTPGVNMVYVDELQDAETEIVQRAIRPTMSGARVVMPQAWFTGTGEKDQSELLRHMRNGLDAGREDLLWLEWSAPPGTDPRDPAGWVWASPDWSDQRAEFLAGESVLVPPQVFRSEYLVAHDAMVTRWLPEAATTACTAVVGAASDEAVCALEQSPSGRWAFVEAWPVGDGVWARVVFVGSPGEAVALAQDRVVWVHAATSQMLPQGSLRFDVMRWDGMSAATDVLRERVLDRSLRVEGLPDEQWAHVVVSQRSGRWVVDAVRSRGDVCGVKALSWAVWAASRIVYPVLEV